MNEHLTYLIIKYGSFSNHRILSELPDEVLISAYNKFLYKKYGVVKTAEDIHIMTKAGVRNRIKLRLHIEDISDSNSLASHLESSTRQYYERTADILNNQV